MTLDEAIAEAKRTKKPVTFNSRNGRFQTTVYPDTLSIICVDTTVQVRVSGDEPR
jgi:hypothetical protein